MTCLRSLFVAKDFSLDRASLGHRQTSKRKEKSFSFVRINRGGREGRNRLDEAVEDKESGRFNASPFAPFPLESRENSLANCGPLRIARDSVEGERYKVRRGFRNKVIDRRKNMILRQCSNSLIISEFDFHRWIAFDASAITYNSY